MTDTHIQEPTEGETWRCPMCGNTTTFRIEANLPVDLTVQDNGQIVLEIDASDAEWPRDAFCLCLNETCGASGEVKDFTPEGPAVTKNDTDRTNLNAALALIRVHYPDAVAAHLETAAATSPSVQRTSGFVFTGIEYESGEINEADLSDAIADEVFDLLADLGWAGVVSESPQSHTRIPLPLAAVPEGPSS